MVNPDPPLMTPKKLVEEFTTIYRETLTDAISDVDLAVLLLNSNFFVIRDAQNQELFFATSTYLDEFLLSAVPPTVGFVKDRLLLWGKEALDFARNNADHESFSEIFSSRLQYEQVLLSLLHFDASGRFMLEYFDQIKIDSGFVGDMLPIAFQVAVQDAAKKALQPALIALSHFLRSYRKLGTIRSNSRVARIAEIRTSPSFLNKKGTIPFAQRAGRYVIESTTELNKVAQYRPVIERAIAKLAEAKTIQRIDNKDRMLSSLLSEYRAEITRPVGRLRVPVVWTIGTEIESRIQRQELDITNDEKLDDDDLFDLRRLLVAHNLFISCFEQSASLLKDVESAAAIYQRVGVAARHFPGGILLRASRNETLVEEETGKTILRAISENNVTTATESKGEVALRFGLLRGLLHAAGGHLLSGIEKILSKAVLDVSAKVLVDTLRADSNFASSVAFLHQEASALRDLSYLVPIYFGYVRSLLLLLGIHI